MKKDKSAFVLSIDGGGVRGIIPAIVLARLEEDVRLEPGYSNFTIIDKFDLISGSSTGGILALCYGVPKFTSQHENKYSARDIANLYLDTSQEIFKLTFWRRLKTAFGLLNEKYSKDGIKNVLRRYVDGITLSDLIKPTLISAYDIERRESVFFKQHHAVRNTDDDYYVEEVAMATSAAPTYFEVAKIADFLQKTPARTLVDGGVFANNPAMCAYVEMKSMVEHRDPTNIKILSLGTGKKSTDYTYTKAKKWGLLGWIRPSIDIMLSSSVRTVHYQLKTIYDSSKCPENYLRVEQDLPAYVDPAMDNAKTPQLLSLKRAGNELYEANRDKLMAFVMQ